MPEDFDKQVQQQGTGYRITPREDVWNRISAELDQKKKRRLAIWWWFPIGLAGALIPFMLFFGNGNTEKSSVPEKHSGPQILVHKDIENNKVRSENPAVQGSIPDKTLQATAAVHSKEKQFQKSGPVAPPSAIDIDKKNSNTTNLPFITPDLSYQTKTSTVPIESDLIKNATGIIPTASLLSKTSPTNAIIPLSSSGSIVVNGQKAAKYKAFWQLEIAGGISYMESGSPLFGSAVSRENNYSNYPIPGNGSSVGSQIPDVMYHPKAGASFSAFLYRRKPLSQRWTASAGLGFQHLRFTQLTGSRKDTTISAQYAGLADKSLSHFYRGGNSVARDGYFSRITLSGEIDYKLPTLRNRISLSTGIQSGYNAWADFLVPDNANGRYLPLSSEKKPVSIAVMGGIHYHTKQQYQFSIQSIYDITRAYTPIGQTSNYWRQWQFSAGIPIKHKK